MIIDNNRVKGRFALLYTIVIFLLLFNLIDDTISGKLGNIINNYYLYGGVILGSGILYFLGKPHFVYDSDGDVLIISNEYPYTRNRQKSKASTTEFPKRKLLSFEIEKGFIRKSLLIRIDSKKHVRSIVFDITYLNSSEIENLDRSLSNVVRRNKKTMNENG